MSRHKTGTKANRAETNRLFQAALRERRRLRRERRHAHGVLTVKEKAEDDKFMSEEVAKIIPAAFTPTPIMSCPTRKEWDEMHDRAKRRRRGFKKYAESNGWVLVGEDYKEKDHWEVPR